MYERSCTESNIHVRVRCAEKLQKSNYERPYSDGSIDVYTDPANFVFNVKFSAILWTYLSVKKSSNVFGMLWKLALKKAPQEHN